MGRTATAAVRRGAALFTTMLLLILIGIPTGKVCALTGQEMRIPLHADAPAQENSETEIPVSETGMILRMTLDAIGIVLISMSILVMIIAVADARRIP